MFFVMHGGRRHESCSSGFLRGEAPSWLRAYGRDGRGGGCAIAGEEPQGRVCAEEAHSSRAGHIGLRGARYSRLWCVARSCVARQCAKERLL